VVQPVVPWVISETCPVAANAVVLRSYRSLRVIADRLHRLQAFIVELAAEDWEALGKLRDSVKWTLRPRKTQSKAG
jgi:hypothetical protein